jgi:hypothetical protein
MQRTFEVWFYIGVVLTVYGVLLVGGGIYQWVHPPPTVLASKHATFWAGLLLLVIGIGYTLVYWPKYGSGDPHDGSRVE